MGVKQAFQGPTGQVQLFLGNKSATLALGRLVCAVPPLPSFAVQLGHVPPMLEPLKQVRVFFSGHRRDMLGCVGEILGENSLSQMRRGTTPGAPP